jgi:hypothetical protein
VISGPKCSLELKIDEEWLEGFWCTTVLGITNCEPAIGDEFKYAYGELEFPFIVGTASNLDALNYTTGPSTLQTEIKIVHTDEQAINLPDVKDCDWEDLDDDVDN